MTKSFQKSDVEIEVSTYSEQENKEVIQGKYWGQLYNDGEQEYMIRYEEKAESEAAVQTTLKIKKDEVKLIRHGSVEMNLRYVPGKRTEGTYQTPYGVVPMETKTTKFSFTWDEEQGELVLAYDLTLGGQDVDHFTLKVSVKKAIL